MDTYLLVDENNSILHRTQEYSCEKKWYMYKSIRPQKSALKAYNSICFHNSHFKKNSDNFIFLTDDEKKGFIKPKFLLLEDNELQKENFKNQKILLNNFFEKIQTCEKKPKSLFVHVRKTKTNKLYSYQIKTFLNWNPNLYELKNLIIFKTKSYPIHSKIKKLENIDMKNDILSPEDYKQYL